MEESQNNYYIRLNEKNQVIKAFSDVFEKPEKTDILVGCGAEAHFRIGSDRLCDELHENANIENGLDIYDNLGIYKLKYVNGLIQKISDEEYQVELKKLQKIKPTELEKLQGQVDYIAMMSGIELEV